MSLPTQLPVFQGNVNHNDEQSSIEASSSQARQSWPSYQGRRHNNSDNDAAAISPGQQQEEDNDDNNDLTDETSLTPPVSPYNRVHRRDLIGYGRPPAVFRKTWTAINEYPAPRWGSVTLKKTPNGRRARNGIHLESPVSPKIKNDSL